MRRRPGFRYHLLNLPDETRNIKNSLALIGVEAPAGPDFSIDGRSRNS